MPTQEDIDAAKLAAYDAAKLSAEKKTAEQQAQAEEEKAKTEQTERREARYKAAKEKEEGTPPHTPEEDDEVLKLAAVTANAQEEAKKEADEATRLAEEYLNLEKQAAEEKETLTGEQITAAKAKADETANLLAEKNAAADESKAAEEKLAEEQTERRTKRKEEAKAAGEATPPNTPVEEDVVLQAAEVTKTAQADAKTVADEAAKLAEELKQLEEEAAAERTKYDTLARREARKLEAKAAGLPTPPITPQGGDEANKDEVGAAGDDELIRLAEEKAARRAAKIAAAKAAGLGTPDEADLITPENEAEPDHPFKVFAPKLYNFELYNYNKLKTMLFNNKRADNLEIRCPEFAILLDHSIALLWLFYSDNKHWNQFSVPQIEWALKFISGIISDKGDHYTDMETIRKHLEQLLFETYSETDIQVLENDKPPVEDSGIFGGLSCPERTKLCTPLPESLKELLSRAPDMVWHLSLVSESDRDVSGHNDDAEITRANMMQSAYMKLNNFERKHLTRINEEIELFEMVKALKQELGYNNGNINPKEITSLRLRMEELEKKLVDQLEHRQ